MDEKQVSPKVAAFVIGGVLVAALAAVAVTWFVERKRDLIAEVPGLGKFVIRDPKDIIQSRLLLGQPWEQPSVELFEQMIKPGMSVADFGAYNGVHSIRFARLVGPTGHVYAFEPNPRAFDMLTANISLNGLGDRIVTYPFGLAEQATSTKMATAEAHNLGGTVACSEQDIKEHRRECEQATADSTLVRIDDDARRWFPTHVDFLKIDVEGYEDRVIAGAKGWIAHDRPAIFIEIWDDRKRARENMTVKASDVVATIESLGYRGQVFRAPWEYLFLPVAPGAKATAASPSASASPSTSSSASASPAASSSAH